MVKRGISIGFLGRFGRSQDLRYLDAALQQAHLHPGFLPEGVKIAVASLMSEVHGEPPADAYPPIGALIALCAFGIEEFEEHNGPRLRADTLARLEAAIARSEGLDASLIILMSHARLLHQSLKDDYAIEIDDIG